MNRFKRGMILAAGLGTRLHPITHKTPKPLVPVLNVPNILFSVDLLRRANIREIAINVHHLQDQVVDYLGDGSRWGVKFTFSREAVLQGTGGGVKRLESFFEGEPFVLANSDFITDVVLTPWIEEHVRRNSLATMALLEDPRLATYYSKVGLDGDGHLCSLPSVTSRPPSRSGIFTGIHFLDASTLKYLKAEPSGINQVLYPGLIRDCPDRVYGTFLSNTFWHDTGELAFLWDTSVRLLGSLMDGSSWLSGFLKDYGGLEEIRDGIWAPKGTSVPTTAEWRPPVVLGANVSVGRGSTLGPFCVLGEGTQVGLGCRLEKFVALPQAKIPDGTRAPSGLWFENNPLSLQKNSAST